MRNYGRVAFVFICVSLAIHLAPQPVHVLTPSPIEPPQNRKDPDKVANALWTQCLSKARQVVLNPNGWLCTDKAPGERVRPTLTADQLDPEIFCAGDDRRRMPTGVIHKLVELVKTTTPEEGLSAAVYKNGIRIIGAAFCQDEVNLSDLTLLHPLVLDNAIFRFGIRARGLNIGGNLSLDGSYIYDNLDISTSKIGGTIFGRQAFIQKISLSDIEVNGHLRLNESLLLDFVLLRRAKIGGGIDLSAAKLATLAIRESQIAQRLNLSDSEASCQYMIEKSDLNEVLAIRAGFGITVPAPAKESSAATTHRTWRPIRTSTGDPSVLAKIRTLPAVKKRASATECPTSRAQFSLLGGTIRSICVQNFIWAAPAEGNLVAPTTLSFNDVTVNDLTLNLWPPKAPDLSAGEQTLEIVGAKIASFSFNFTDTYRKFTTLVDRVSIEQIYATDRNCGAPVKETQLMVPDTTRAKAWIAKNDKSTLQPYVAFIKAYENAGADATELKIAKANLQFRNDLNAKWNELAGGSWTDIFSLKQPIDALRLSINYIGGGIADFGFRPYKSLIYIAMAIAAFYLTIRYWLRVTHAKSELRTDLMPVNVYSVIDWMIPLYNLDPAHSKISGYYFKDGTPIDAGTERRMNRVLLLLRICGVLAAVFLTATLKVFVLN